MQYIELPDGCGLELIQPPADAGHFGSLSATFTHVRDSDGHAIELNDATSEEIVEATAELHPEAAL